MKNIKGAQLVLKFKLVEKNPRLSEFAVRVLKETSKIKLGQQRSYSYIAAKIGRPKAVRAVGRVLSSNPFPLSIPCHRVIASDGKLKGYLLGSRKKQALLKQEKMAKDLLAKRKYIRSKKFNCQVKVLIADSRSVKKFLR